MTFTGFLRSALAVLVAGRLAGPGPAVAAAIPGEPAGPGAAPPGAAAESLRARPELDPDSGAEMLGRPAPEFRFTRWLDSPPLTTDSLRGKVVLIRFWTDECRFCRNTLPAIEALRLRHAGRGLVVIGAYHPNEPRAVSDAFVRKSAKQLGFGGPVAVDQDWATLERWWLGGHPERNWVSASFLLDREGVVRWVHGGGEYHPSADARHHSCDASFAELERTVDALLR